MYCFKIFTYLIYFKTYIYLIQMFVIFFIKLSKICKGTKNYIYNIFCMFTKSMNNYFICYFVFFLFVQIVLFFFLWNSLEILYFKTCMYKLHSDPCDWTTITKFYCFLFFEFFPFVFRIAPIYSTWRKLTDAQTNQLPQANTNKTQHNEILKMFSMN